MGVSGAVVGGFIIPYSIKLSIFIIDIKNEYMFVLNHIFSNELIIYLLYNFEDKNIIFKYMRLSK